MKRQVAGGILNIAAGVILGALWASPALAQNDAASYPSKPIHIIVGFAAGGGNDILARIVGQKL